MLKQSEAGGYSVYLGFGVYLAGVIESASDKPNEILLDGATEGQALSLAFVGQAAAYSRGAAVRMCHVVRRAGARAWVVRRPVVSI